MPELWTLSFDHWTLPITVEHPAENGVVLVKPSPIALLVKQRAAIEYFLDKTCYRRTDDGWWMEIKQLSDYAVQEFGDKDPEECVRWIPPKFVEEKRPDCPEMEGFFEQVASSGWFKSPKTAEIIFQAFCKQMVFQLAVKRKGVDLGFCKLLPLPYRANWKEVLLYRLSKGKNLTKKFCRVRRWDLNLLKSTDLIAYSPQVHGILWTLEVLPKRWWFKATFDCERARYKQCNKKNIRLYWTRVGNRVKDAEDYAKECFNTYLSQIAHPALQVFEKLLVRREVPDPYQSKSYYKDFEFPPAASPPIVRSTTGVCYGRYGLDLQEKDPNVRSLYGLRSGARTLRPPWTTDSDGGASGVPVPDEAQSQTQGS